MTQLNIVHDTVKATFPDMPVVVGGILSHSMKNIAICNGSKHFGEPDPTQLERFCNSPQYLDHVERLEEVLSQGRYDVVDQHLYFDEENWGVYIDTLRTVVLPPSRRDTPIIVTEFGGPDAKTDSRDDEYHARKLADYLEALESAGVTFAYYFTLVEPPEDNGFGDQSSYAESGLIARDTGNPKPAYAVFKDYIASREGDKG